MTQWRRALENIRTDSRTRGARLIFLVCCMLAAGILSLFLTNYQRMVPSWMLDSEVVAYLRGDIAPADMQRIAGELSGWPEIEKVRPVSREAARKRMEAQLGDWRGILDGLPENPLPPSIELTLKSKVKLAADLDSIAEKIRQFPEVQEVFYGKTWEDKLEFAVNFVRPWGLGALGFLALAAVFVIAGKVSLSVASHREELEIYRIVGATPFFAEFPFYVEGMIEGGASALLAAFLFICFLPASPILLPVPLSAALSLPTWEMVLFAVAWVTGGIAVGWAGARIGLRNAPRI